MLITAAMARRARRRGHDARKGNEDADIDALIRRIGGLGDELGRAERRREVRGTSPLSLLHQLGRAWGHLVHVADDSEVGVLEDRRVRVLVDGDDGARPCMPTSCWIAPEIPHAM